MGEIEANLARAEELLEGEHTLVLVASMFDRIDQLKAERDRAREALRKLRAKVYGENYGDILRDGHCPNCNYMAKPPICTKCGCAIGEEVEDGKA